MKKIIVKPEKVSIDPKLKRELKTLVEEESQVIVHCSMFLLPGYSRLRIWNNTNLLPHNSDRKCELVHADNISFYPIWTEYEAGINHFTLIFKGLPKDCDVFDLFEDIPEPGGFIKTNIPRNSSDVYHIKL